MNNGFIKLIFRIFKIIITLLIILIFSVIFVQRITNNNVKLFGYSLYTVVTESMLPEYNVYDMIIAREVDYAYINIGDDVVYLGEVDDFKDKIVTHRVISKEDKNGKFMFITKGINNDIEDPEISEDQILGKVIYKSIILSFLSKITNNTYGFYFLVFIPLVVIIFLEIMEVINEKKNLKEN